MRPPGSAYVVNHPPRRHFLSSHRLASPFELRRELKTDGVHGYRSFVLVGDGLCEGEVGVGRHQQHL
jgi:hypothetical protein